MAGVAEMTELILIISSRLEFRNEVWSVITFDRDRIGEKAIVVSLRRAEIDAHNMIIFA